MPAAPDDVKAPPADAITSPTGLASKVLQAGNGTEKPGPADTVTVHYSGWTTDGKQFDSSVDRGKTISFGLDQVIKGWTEALLQMPVGSKWQLFIPSELAYGERGAGRQIGPNSTLIFDIELVGIQDKAQAPK